MTIQNKIICIESSPKLASAYYRSIGPLCKMRRIGWDVSFPKAIEWSTVYDSDLVYIQRPVHDSEREIIGVAKTHKKKIVIDYDDFLFGIGPDNRAYHAYAEKGAQDNMQKIIDSADLITVSTEHLKTMLAEKTKTRIEVIPNALDVKLYPIAKSQRTQSVIWRGSDTHVKDLESVSKPLHEIIEKYPKISFIFIGYSPHHFAIHKNVYFQKPVMPFGNYMDLLSKYKPAVVYHPLAVSDFNKSKSMCSWLEATAAGACFVGPQFEEFNRPGIIQYEPENDSSFLAAMVSAIEHTMKGGNEPLLHSGGYILENLTLEKINQRRHALYQELI